MQPEEFTCGQYRANFGGASIIDNAGSPFTLYQSVRFIMHHDVETAHKRFVSHAPGFWPEVPAELWNDWKWQLKHRVTRLEELEAKINLTREERAGVLLSGHKLSLAVTPHFFNLIEPHDPGCPIRRQVIPRVEEGTRAPEEMADPCGEDSNMPVPGLVHRYPDRVLFLITD